jgi:hypothetical protein
VIPKCEHVNGKYGSQANLFSCGVDTKASTKLPPRDPILFGKQSDSGI